jgi:hypothetical protein
MVGLSEQIHQAAICSRQKLIAQSSLVSASGRTTEQHRGVAIGSRFNQALATTEAA